LDDILSPASLIRDIWHDYQNLAALQHQENAVWEYYQHPDSQVTGSDELSAASELNISSMSSPGVTEDFSDEPVEVQL
jgi:hypothetical protein